MVMEKVFESRMLAFGGLLAFGSTRSSSVPLGEYGLLIGRAMSLGISRIFDNFCNIN